MRFVSIFIVLVITIGSGASCHSPTTMSSATQHRRTQPRASLVDNAVLPDGRAIVDRSSSDEEIAEYLSKRYPPGTPPFGLKIKVRSHWPSDTKLHAIMTADVSSIDRLGLRVRLSARMNEARELAWGDIKWSNDMLETPFWPDLAVSLGRMPSDTDGIIINVLVDRRKGRKGKKRVEIWSTSFRVDIHSVQSVDDILAAIKSHTVDDTLRRLLRMRLSWNNSVELDRASIEAAMGHLSNETFAIRVQFIQGGEMFASGDAWWKWSDDDDGARRLWPDSTQIELVGQNLRELLKRRQGGSPITIKITGNPEMALRNFDGHTYWDGMIEVPIDDVLTMRPSER